MLVIIKWKLFSIVAVFLNISSTFFSLKNVFDIYFYSMRFNQALRVFFSVDFVISGVDSSNLLFVICWIRSILWCMTAVKMKLCEFCWRIKNIIAQFRCISSWIFRSLLITFIFSNVSIISFNAWYIFSMNSFYDALFSKILFIWSIM